MKLDKDIFTYYEEYVSSAQYELEQCNKKREEAVVIADTARHLMENNLDLLNKTLEFDIRDYKEFKDDRYYKDGELHDKITKLFIKAKVNNNERNLIVYTIRWIKALERIHKYDTKKEILQRRSEMKFDTFRNYVRRYYSQVQVEILEGNSYRYCHGIGDIYINRCKNNKGKDYKGTLDYRETEKRKEQLLKEGKRLYNKEDAKQYKAAGKIYDGVDYRVYKKEDYLYQFAISNSRIKNCGIVKFERTDYRSKALRGITDEEISILCKTKQDIYDLDADMRVKLKQLLILDPTCYINYIRNNEQKPFKYRAFSRKD